MKTSTSLKIMLTIILLAGIQQSKATVFVNEKFKNSGTSLTPGSNGWTAPSAQTAGTVPTITNVSSEEISDTLNLAYIASATTNGKTYGKNSNLTFGTKPTLYLAFKVKVVELDAITNNQAIWAVGLGTSDFKKAPIKVSFEETSPSGIKVFNVGVSKGGDNNTNRSRTTANYLAGTKLLIVAKYQAVSATSLDDVITLYINPSLSDNEPATPSLTAPAGSFQDFIEADSLTVLYRQAGEHVKITDVTLTDSWADLATKIPTAINELSDNSTLNVAVEAGKIKITSAENNYIEIFDAMGKRIASKHIGIGTSDIDVNNKGLLIVKAGNKAFKVII